MSLVSQVHRVLTRRQRTAANIIGYPVHAYATGNRARPFASSADTATKVAIGTFRVANSSPNVNRWASSSPHAPPTVKPSAIATPAQVPAARARGPNSSNEPPMPGDKRKAATRATVPVENTTPCRMSATRSACLDTRKRRNIPKLTGTRQRTTRCDATTANGICVSRSSPRSAPVPRDRTIGVVIAERTEPKAVRVKDRENSLSPRLRARSTGFQPAMPRGVLHQPPESARLQEIERGKWS